MNPLKSVRATITLGFVLALAIALMVNNDGEVLESIGERWSLVVWLHVFFGVIWIGLLYYFNFVQVPAVGEALADEGGPGPAAINKYVAPRALWWFRWGALLTWITGATALHYYLPMTLHDAFMLKGGVMGVTMGIGAWLGTIMLFNVWVLIWPNQKKILGIVKADAQEIAKAKNTALIASRTNTLLSIPMLMCMVGYGHGLPL
ncbi:MAG: urate hydroxylase PuuD [Pseudomonadota bacterium]|nr:urate hydroxylase PuuD [Pseudomonadota bacterium]|tara:strand:+ start:373 stop:984 length:612 start_codon:yes stop_codon:yes gene_type:complete